jgi:phage-related protein (TIGR01555 family)
MTKTKTKKKAKTEARADKRSGILDQARRAALMEELGAQLYAPPLAAKVFETEEKVRERFALPVTLGTTEEVRLAQDAELADTGLYSTIYKSLQQHGYELGQYPVTSFVGYGALQQIAQNGMIRACVQTVADDITREWITITGDDAEAVEEIQTLQEKKYHLRTLFHEAATLTGYMGGAFIYVDTGTENPELPLRYSNESAELQPGTKLRFVVVDPVNVSPGDYNAIDPLKPDYLKPRYFWVLGTKVHESRLLRLFDNPPPTLLQPAYNFLGIPQAQILWDYVMHWNQCRVYTADLVRKVSLLVFQTSTDDIFNSPNGVQLFDIRMKALQRYRDNNAVFVCDKEGESVMNVQTSIAGCTDVVRQSLEMVASINRTPAVKLLGISPSGFNATGESDIRNYYDYIRSKQELRREAINTCLEAIELVEMGSINSNISFDFNELSKEDEASAAMTAQTRAGALATLAQVQAISAEEMREAVKKEPAMHLGFLSDEVPEGEPEDIEGLLGALQQATTAVAEPAPASNPPDESRQLLQSLGGLNG